MAELDENVERWRRWVETDIRNDVIGMHSRRKVWQEVDAILRANSEVSELPSVFWDFHYDNYATTQAVAIRRQGDRDTRTSSLARLIAEMEVKADCLTREYFVGLWRNDDAALLDLAEAAFDKLSGVGSSHLDPAIPAADLEALLAGSKKLRAYVNQHVAHDQAEPTAELPTLSDLHASIDTVGAAFIKYANVLTASTWLTLEAVVQDDWKAIFRRPWIA